MSLMDGVRAMLDIGQVTFIFLLDSGDILLKNGMEFLISRNKCNVSESP